MVFWDISLSEKNKEDKEIQWLNSPDSIPVLEEEKPDSLYPDWERPLDRAWIEWTYIDYVWSILTSQYVIKDWIVYQKDLSKINTPTFFWYSRSDLRSADPDQKSRGETASMFYSQVIEEKKKLGEISIEWHLFDTLPNYQKQVIRSKDTIIYKWTGTGEKMIEFLCWIYECSVANLKEKLKKKHPPKNQQEETSFTIMLQDWSPSFIESCKKLLWKYWINFLDKLGDFNDKDAHVDKVKSSKVLIVQFWNTFANNNFSQNPKELDFAKTLQSHEWKNVHLFTTVKLHQNNTENAKGYDTDQIKNRMLANMDRFLWPYFKEHSNKFEFDYQYHPPKNREDEWEIWKNKISIVREKIQEIFTLKGNDLNYRIDLLNKNIPWRVLVWVKMKETLKNEYPSWLQIRKHSFDKSKWESPFHVFYPWISSYFIASWRPTKKTNLIAVKACWGKDIGESDPRSQLYKYYMWEGKRQEKMVKKDPFIYEFSIHTHEHWWMQSTLANIWLSEEWSIRKTALRKKMNQDFWKKNWHLLAVPIISMIWLYIVHYEEKIASNAYFLTKDTVSKIRSVFDNENKFKEQRRTATLQDLQEIYTRHWIWFNPKAKEWLVEWVAESINHELIKNELLTLMNENYYVYLHWEFSGFTLAQAEWFLAQAIDLLVDESNHNEDICKFVRSMWMKESLETNRRENLWRLIGEYISGFNSNYWIDIYRKINSQDASLLESSLTRIFIENYTLKINNQVIPIEEKHITRIYVDILNKACIVTENKKNIPRHRDFYIELKNILVHPNWKEEEMKKMFLTYLENNHSWFEKQFGCSIYMPRFQ